MNSFLQWLSEYWRYAAGLAAAVIAAAIVFSKASKSYKAYYARYREEEAEIKRLTALKEKFCPLTLEAILSAENGELLEGAALSYQLALQKAENIEEEFSLLSEEKKFVYTLDVFLSDKTLKTFFKENGKELSELIVPALSAVGLSEEAKKADFVRKMYDVKEDSVSFDEKKIDEIQNYFDSADVLTKIKLNGAEYIKENSQKLV